MNNLKYKRYKSEVQIIFQNFDSKLSEKILNISMDNIFFFWMDNFFIIIHQANK